MRATRLPALLIFLAACAQGTEEQQYTTTKPDAGRDAKPDVSLDSSSDSSGAGGSGGMSGGYVDSGGSGGSGGSSAVDSGMDANTCQPVVAGDCNVPLQCGCQPNESCIPDEFGYSFCQAAGSGLDYTWCGKNGDCRPGSACVSNVCHPFCDVNMTCSPGGICIQAINDFSQSPVPGAYVCVQTCDPIHPQNPQHGLYPCGPGLGCMPGDNTYSPDCYAAGSKPVGFRCSTQLDCAIGTLCVGSSGSGTCMELCSTYDMCSSGTCYSLSNQLYSGGVYYGVCQ